MTCKSFTNIPRTDTDAEIALVIELAKEAGAYDAVECTHWADGGIDIQILSLRVCVIKKRFTDN